MSAKTQGTGQGISSHTMKLTKRGRPFLKDTLDLFAILILSLELKTNKPFWKSFPNSFTTDDASSSLANLRFFQSNRGPDPRDPSRIVTTTMTRTFSMTRDMAKATCQHFMDARLIENASDRNSNFFRERGVFHLTPKGLHVLEWFISKNGCSVEPLANVSSSQPICLKLLHLERRSSDDEIIISQAVVTALFRRFAGRTPNYMPDASVPLDPSQEYHERSKGIPLTDVSERQQGILGRSNVNVYKYCFQAVTVLEWLCDFTSIIGRDEAAEIAAHFVRYGLIALVSDKRKRNDSAIIFTVRGNVPTGTSPVSQQGEFRCTSKAIYHITDEGRRVALWDTAADAKSRGRDLFLSPSHNTDEQGVEITGVDKLKWILEKPAIRAVFRDFLRTNPSEHYLSYWLEVEDLKRKFITTSSVIGGGKANQICGKTPGQEAMERHHESLILATFVIYNTYHAPSGRCELNIGDELLGDLLQCLSQIFADTLGESFRGRIEPEQAVALNATQLHTLIRLYDRIQTQVFCIMAANLVPRFIKTPEFIALKGWLGDDETTNGEVFESG